MEKASYRKNEYRYVTIAVDSYENRMIQGRIWHSVLQEEAGFGGWIDFMKIINQIYDKTEFPKQTVNVRNFEPVQERILHWKKPGTESGSQSPEATLQTFILKVEYRGHASWQGTVLCSESGNTYVFKSFLKLLRIMDSILRGRSPDDEESGTDRFSCRLVASKYDGGDVQGELQRVSLNWRKEFTSVTELLMNMLELSDTLKAKSESEYGKLISNESLRFSCRGEGKTTFVIKILYREYDTWQGTIYCKEQRTEKSFRSFMELLYLITSALEIDREHKKCCYSPGEISREYGTKKYGTQEYRIQEYRTQEQIEQVS